MTVVLAPKDRHLTQLCYIVTLQSLYVYSCVELLAVKQQHHKINYWQPVRIIDIPQYCPLSIIGNCNLCVSQHLPFGKKIIFKNSHMPCQHQSSKRVNPFVREVLFENNLKNIFLFGTTVAQLNFSVQIIILVGALYLYNSSQLIRKKIGMVRLTNSQENVRKISSRTGSEVTFNSSIGPLPCLHKGYKTKDVLFTSFALIFVPGM